jgi:gluconolactonase
MKSKTQLAMAGCLLASVLAVSPILLSQQGQPQPAKQVTVTAIPGVVADGAKWTQVWTQPDLADGVVAYQGGVLFAQEETSSVAMLDKSGDYSLFAKKALGPGALGIDAMGRVLAVQRSCTDPGQHPELCKIPTALAELDPEYKVLTDNDGKGFGRLHDLVVDSKGGAFFNGPTGVFYFSPAGKLTQASMNTRTNGIMLSRDDKTLYFTNGMVLDACDVQPDGTCMNERTFAKLEAGGGGDGMAMDSQGRLYTSSPVGVQVVGADGKYLGLIPSPRPVTSLCFSGPDKKTLYAITSGATQPDGSEYTSRKGVALYSRTTYKIDLLAQGYMSRVK